MIYAHQAPTIHIGWRFYVFIAAPTSVQIKNPVLNTRAILTIPLQQIHLNVV